jgi:hypothetical protein
MKVSKWIALAVIALGFVVISPSVALADEDDEEDDDCVEVGWRGDGGGWVYNKARVTSFDKKKNRFVIEYFNMEANNERVNVMLDLKFFEKERAEGRDMIVIKGRWITNVPKNPARNREGKVRFEMAKMKSRAKGWYTHPDTGAKHDFALRECR